MVNVYMYFPFFLLFFEASKLYFHAKLQLILSLNCVIQAIMNFILTFKHSCLLKFSDDDGVTDFVSLAVAVVVVVDS